MTTTAPDLSVILVNWNAMGVTADALMSLQTHTQGVSYEVFVIDNGSTKDESVQELPKRFSWVRFLFNAVNEGFTRANNRGIREAKGRYVLLLNNDTVQTEDALSKAVRYMDEHLDVGALGITHLNNDEGRTFQPSFFGFPRPWSEIRGLLGFGGPLPPPPEPTEQDVDWVCGSFLMIRRSTLEQVGELDERYFIYDEDIDWCLRAKQAGWKIRYWPGVSMVHLGAASNPLMKDKTFTMFRSHLSFIHKHHGKAAALCYYLAMGLRLVGATVKQTLYWVFGKASVGDIAKRWKRQNQFLFLKSGRVGG